MNQVFSVIDKDLSPFVIQKLAALTGEKESKITELAPSWEAIILGGLLKLVNNRIRFNALYNLILQKPFPEKYFISFASTSMIKGELDEISLYGEGLMSILIPDKKSAIAMLLSSELGCKSSTYLKGLTFYFALYGSKLKHEDYAVLKDWKTFGVYFIEKQQDFNALCPQKLHVALSEILLLSDVIKLETGSISYQNEESESTEYGLWSNLINLDSFKYLMYFILLLITSGMAYWYFNVKVDSSENTSAETEEIIPIDSLNKLNDSLTKAVLDSNRIANDTTVMLKWPDGKQIWVPKKSILVNLYQYLNDSTQVEPLELRTFELAFEKDLDVLIKPANYLYKNIASFLNRSKTVNIKVVCFAINNDKSALNRAFVIKNRLVGEGLSLKRIEVKGNDSNYNIEVNHSDNEQVIFIFSKRNY